MAPLTHLLQQLAEPQLAALIALLSLIFSLLGFVVGIYQLVNRPIAGIVCVGLGVLSLVFAWKVYARAPQPQPAGSLSISPTAIQPVPVLTPTPLPRDIPINPVVPAKKLGGKGIDVVARNTDSSTVPTVRIIPAFHREPPPSVTSEPAPVSATELNELEDEALQIANRAGPIDDSLNRLRREQEKSGFGLRIDIAEHQHGMHNNLTAAKEALANRDIERARTLLDRSLRDVEALEHFLGR